MGRRVLAAAMVAFAAMGLSLLGGGAAAQTRDCARDDVPCRLDRIEERLREIERAVEHGRTADGGVGVATERTCFGGDCQNAAASVCRSAGFDRGVPDDMERRSGDVVLLRATCFNND